MTTNENDDVARYGEIRCGDAERAEPDQLAAGEAGMPEIVHTAMKRGERDVASGAHGA
jgi:hypothetical protein